MHDLPIDPTKLRYLVRQCMHFNIFPILLPRYLHGQHPAQVAGVFSELVAECESWLSAMTLDEIASLIDSLPAGISQFITRDVSSSPQPDLERVATYYLVHAVQREYRPIQGCWDSDLSKSEVLKVYPELQGKLDKDGLLCIDDSMDLMDGGILYRDHVLHYHQLLRRGFGSNPNFDFTGRFLGCYHRTRSTNSFRIAIDHRRIMTKEAYQAIAEFDAWYGPPFDPAKLDDPSAVGLTVVKRNKDSLFELTNHLDRTEFFWSYRDSTKTFEVEEVSDVDFTFEGYNLNRYVHSERDISDRVLKHLDGAVKVYLPDNYEARFHSKMPRETKCHAKPKLFRVDGNIAIEDWINLISFFFKSNEMIIEYFNPVEFTRVFEERVRDFKTWKEKQEK